MKDSPWVDAQTACLHLGIKPQTLYAYVSRKYVRAMADRTDARRSLYSLVDIEALVQQNRRPRSRAAVAEHAIRWGDPVLCTAVSEVRDGMFWLRGRTVVDCAQTMTLEAVAAHLCAVADMSDHRNSPTPQGPTPLSRALRFLVDMQVEARPMQGRSAACIAAEGAALMSGVCNALLGASGTGPIHRRVQRIWSLCDPGTETIRTVLVLLSDHELNPSTFAVRVCASTGASLPAALLTGLSTLSGPRHGGAAGMARAAILAELSGKQDQFYAQQTDQTPYRFGYGHPLYAEGDPRAACILGRLPPNAPPLAAVRSLATRCQAAPNVDAALAALSLVYPGPQDAPETLFAMGRLAGWIAHAIEQVSQDGVIRPRARYRDA